MSNFIGSITGANKAKEAAQASEFNALQAAQQTQAATQQAEASAQQQEAAAQSDQGQQLALLSKQQAVSDNDAASLSRNGIGRALLGYNRRTSGALGGS